MNTAWQVCEGCRFLKKEPFPRGMVCERCMNPKDKQWTGRTVLMQHFPGEICYSPVWCPGKVKR